MHAGIHVRVHGNRASQPASERRELCGIAIGVRRETHVAARQLRRLFVGRRSHEENRLRYSTLPQRERFIRPNTGQPPHRMDTVEDGSCRGKAASVGVVLRDRQDRAACDALRNDVDVVRDRGCVDLEPGTERGSRPPPPEATKLRLLMRMVLSPPRGLTRIREASTLMRVERQHNTRGASSKSALLVLRAPGRPPSSIR